MQARFLTKLYLLASICGIVLLIAAYYFEYFLGMDPCPLCMTQRLVTLSIVIFFLFAMFKHQVISTFMLVMALVVSIVGIYIADHHVFLQSLPRDQVPACGPPLAYMIETLPFTKFISVLMQGDGHCADVSWSFLTLSMPEWTRICFTIYALFAIVSIYFTIRSKKHHKFE